MNLEFDLKLDNPIEDEKKTERVNKAKSKKEAQAFQPTVQQVFVDGWIRPTTGKRVKPIFETKLDDKERAKMVEVLRALKDGELDVGLEDMKKFSKTHANNLYLQLQESKKADIIANYISNIPENYIPVTTANEFEDMITVLKKEKRIAVDTETTGLDLDKDYVVGMSFSADKQDLHYYIPFYHQNTNCPANIFKPVAMDWIREHLSDNKDLEVIMFNAKFDMHMLAKEGVKWKGKVFDLMVAMQILNENEMSYSLKGLATKYGKFFGFEDESLTFDQLFSRDPRDFYINADWRLAYFYGAKDTHLTLRFFNWAEQHLKKQEGLYNTFFNIEAPITKISFYMESAGMAIDHDYAIEYGAELAQQIEANDLELAKTFGDINLNSNQQLAEKLFDEMGIEPPTKDRSVKAGNLKIIAQEVPEVSLLLEQRTVSKLHSSFIDPIPQKVWKDKRIHGSFNQSGTKTGRFASKNPNMQNLPYDARPMFKAPEGQLIIGIDFSQIEPRVLAHMSEDPLLQDPYNNGRDLYATTASMVYGKKFGLTYDQCLEKDDESWRKIPQLKKHPRKIFKQGLLSTMYETSGYSLGKLLGISEEEGEEFITDFHESFPRARQYAEECIAFVDKQGYTTTMAGRKRRFEGHLNTVEKYKHYASIVRNKKGKLPENIWATGFSREIKSGFFYAQKDYNRVVRQIVNARTQGSGADIMKIAMIKLFDKLIEFNATTEDVWLMVGTIHDEVLIQVPYTITAEQFEELENCMKDSVKLDVPLKVDTEVAIRWGQGVPKHEFLQKGLSCWDSKGWLHE